MGIYYCDVCSEELCGETFACATCARGGGDGVVLCEGCANAATCDVCGEKCCTACRGESEEAYACCGKVLCGAGADRKEYGTPGALRAAFGVARDACFWRHEVLGAWDGCSHARCSEQPEDAGCARCAREAATAREVAAIEADKEKARALAAEPGTSAAFRAVLQRFVKDPHFVDKHAAKVEQMEQEARDEHRMKRCRY